MLMLIIFYEMLNLSFFFLFVCILWCQDSRCGIHALTKCIIFVVVIIGTQKGTSHM